MDDRILGYAMDALPPAEAAELERHLAADPAARAELARIRRLLDRLAADRPDPVPPPGLALSTIIRTVEHVVEHRLLDASPSADTLDDFALDPPPVSEPAAVAPVARWWQGWGGWAGRRADAAVAAGIGLLAVGLGLSFVSKQHAARDRLACEQGLHDLHTGLVGYADTHGGRLPHPGTTAVPTAGAFADQLARSGQWSGRPVCPGQPAVLVGYVYTLGHRDATGELVGPRLVGFDLPADRLPLVADLRGGPHPGGQNVLFAGGQVRFVTVPTVGPSLDDIYTNDAGRVRAGLHVRDASLGGPADVP